MMNPPEDLIYTPAKRRGIGVLIMFAGPSGSGKTKSALRLATGLANGGPIGFCDTEHGRALYYADDFEFQHLELKEPFRPSRFELAAQRSQQAKHAVWICDSFSHEHTGPGGLLAMAEAELQRMAGDDWNKRERMKMASWIAPKAEHNHLVQRLWQCNFHILLCCHAQKKIELVKNDKGKIVPVDIGFQPICGDDIPYAMTASFMFSPKQPGVPIWLKHFDKLDPIFRTDQVIDEDTGRRLAAWARGDKAPQESTSTPSLARLGRAQSDAERESPPSEAPGGSETSPPPSESSPREGKEITPSEAPNKNEVAVLAIIQAFDAIQDQAEYWQAIDDAERRKRIAWFKDKKPELHARILAAQDAAGVRAGVKQPAQEPA